ncbi:MAG: GNAT family N-acetyltransferase [Oscillospiraceae bacterium]|nr:GNAT family N-acetyltransferase [Oscillospiraceae bacterium]
MSINTILLSDFTDPRFRAAFQAYFTELGISVRDWDGLFREMDGENTNCAYLMLDGSGGTVGFLQFQLTAFSNWFFEEPFGFVREFWVTPGYRRQGHGKTLLRMAEDYFKAHGADRSVLTADDAVGFYLANGYERSPSIHAKNKMEVFVKTLR